MYSYINTCLCCGGDNLSLVLDLNSQPLANSYLKDPKENEDTFPLGINFCSDCTHTQLTASVDPDLLFKNYLYVSGTTSTLREYFDWFAQFVSTYTNGRNVLDIACNDGSQLDAFKREGYNTFGIDPAKNLYEISSKKHSIVCDYFTKESSKEFNQTFDAIVAQNVLAHNSYPLEFLLSCKDILSQDGYIFIQTSQADMIKNNQFDTIYHEHISFFSVRSFAALAKRAGLNLIEVWRTPVHGTSFVFVLSKTKEDRSNYLADCELLQLNLDTMKDYSAKCNKIAIDLKQLIDGFKANGKKVIGYGAAAKGNTLINFAKFDLDFIIDDNPLKQGLYSPGSRIKIVSIDELKDISEAESIVFIPLAWNFFDEIKSRIKNVKNSDADIFIKYFPEVSLYEKNNN